MWVLAYHKDYVAEKFRCHERIRCVGQAFDSRSPSVGDTLHRFGPLIHGCGEVLFQLHGLVQCVAMTAALSVMLLYLSPSLFFTMNLSLLPFIPVALAFSRRLKADGSDLSERWKKMLVALSCGVKNLLYLRICGTDGLEKRQLQSALSAYRVRFLKFKAILPAFFHFPQVAGFVGLCLALRAAGTDRMLLQGTLLVFFYLFLRYVSSVSVAFLHFSELSFSWPNLQALQGSRSQESPQAGSTIRVSQLRLPDAPDSGGWGWRLEGVGFSHAGSAKHLFRDLDLTLPEGSLTALTGRSGAGKSTLLQLLLGELQPTRGQVLIRMGSQEYPLAEVRDALLSQTAYVGTENFMVDATLLENLLYGSVVKPSRKELERALEIAECDFVGRLTDGLNHRLTEQGEGISAGEKQRLAFARAWLRKPKILILDEATSNLDLQTEQAIVRQLAGLKGEVTIVAATHRTALLGIADRIVDVTTGT